MSIVDLDEAIGALPTEERVLLSRIFDVRTMMGRLRIPAPLADWIKGRFGSLEAVEEQKIVKVTNLITLEGSLFNALRAKRPMEVSDASNLDEVVKCAQNDQFCRPLENTPEDIFGRINGRSCVTAGNVAKYDGYHGIVIFNEHNPLAFTEGDIADRLDVACSWADKAHRLDEEFRFFFIMWNCLWRSGASIVHGHMQMTLSRGIHYAKVEALRRAAKAYERSFGSNYFTDLYRVHNGLGLGFERGGTRIMAHLAPVKEKEVLLFSGNLDMSFKSRFYEVLKCFIMKMGVTNFNAAIYMPPLSMSEAERADWTGFPVLARIVDRGDIRSRTCDVGAMELYANSVISADPFWVASALRSDLLP
jgi:hypothetical protein